MSLISVKVGFTQKMADFENRRVDVEISEIDTELSLEAQLEDADTVIDASLGLLKIKLSDLYDKGTSKDIEESE
tara:strand:- start:131 stop:352 length:222 start_codon:yes stop_codon:yes gene_type:complete